MEYVLIHLAGVSGIIRLRGLLELSEMSVKAMRIDGLGRWDDRGGGRRRCGNATGADRRTP